MIYEYQPTRSGGEHLGHELLNEVYGELSYSWFFFGLQPKLREKFGFGLNSSGHLAELDVGLECFEFVEKVQSLQTTPCRALGAGKLSALPCMWSNAGDEQSARSEADRG